MPPANLPAELPEMVLFMIVGAGELVRMAPPSNVAELPAIVLFWTNSAELMA